MGEVTVQFLGTGTPLGQGGRLQACILVRTAETRVLVDCGATSMVGLARAGVAPESIDAILLSHLHADHFGGVPLLLLDAAVRERTPQSRQGPLPPGGGPLLRGQGPLIVAGPAATADRVRESLEVAGWSAAWTHAREAPLVEFVTLHEREPASIAGLSVTSYAVPHNPATNPTALRIVWDGTTIAYSGDAGWTPALREVAADADLFICGVWSFATLDPTFLDYRTLVDHRHELSCKRLVLTHLGPEMLTHLDDVAADGVEIAEDSLTLTLLDDG